MPFFFSFFLDALKQYFAQFGNVVHCTIMRDPTNGRSRGFAFLTFSDPTVVNKVMVKEHFLDGKLVRGLDLLLIQINDK